MGFIADKYLDPASGDTSEVSLRKILQRLDQAKVRPQGEIVPGEFDYVRLDPTTGGMLTVPYEHHEVHEGNHYTLSDWSVLNIGESSKYQLTTPAAPPYIHFLFDIVAYNLLEATFYEGSDYASSNPLTAVNSNRNSTNTSGMIIHSSFGAGTDYGTMLWNNIIGGTGGSARSGLLQRENEYILKPSTKYVFELVSTANGNRVTLNLSWYEHFARD